MIEWLREKVEEWYATGEPERAYCGIPYAFIDWLEKENLLSLNNENDYIGSGSMGYTRALPQPGWKEGDAVRARDLWVLSESQETVSVSPQMFEEFVFQYQLPVIERFGRCYYGCCEPLHTRWHVVKKIANLKLQ